MAPDRDDPLPRIDDPFLAEDPQAYEREKRRLEREARRRERERRSTLAERVGEALDGAGERGREIIAEGRERVRNPQPADGGREPPPLRGGRSAGGQPRGEEGRLSAEQAMPRRPSRRPALPAEEPGSGRDAARDGAAAGSPGAADAARPGAAPEPEASARSAGAGSGATGARRPERATDPAGPALGGGGDDWIATPPPAPPGGRAARGGAGDGPGGTRLSPVWARRIAALAALLALLLAAAYAIAELSGGEDAPPPPKGPAKLKTIDLTIPEGYTRSQMAHLAKEAGLKGNYEKATARAPKGFSPAKLGAPRDASLEGFLFPATYNLEKGANVKALIGEQLAAFEDNMSEISMKRAKGKGLTVYDVVTIASMIEREVQIPKERPLVAAVIYNRLAQGIPLGIDATLRYELDNFDQPLKQSELESDTPYNTRINPGLPPTPISNPGRAALEAAARPANTGYLYYVVKPGTCGKHYFTDDYDDFLNASREYQEALEAEGGSPTEC